MALLYAANLPPAKRAALAARGDHTAHHKEAHILGEVEFGPFSDGLRFPCTEAMTTLLAGKSAMCREWAWNDYVASRTAEAEIRGACSLAQELFDEILCNY